MKLGPLAFVWRALLWGGLAIVVALSAQAASAPGDEREAGARTALAAGVSSVAQADPAVRDQFIAVERIARLPVAQQGKELPRLYRDLAPPLMSMVVEGIVSSMPAHLLVRDRQFAQGDFAAGFINELDGAVATMTPEVVADTILTNHHAIILRVASRRRCMSTLMQHKEEVAELVAADLATDDATAVGRGFACIAALHLTEFLEKAVSIYLGNGRFAEQARTALIWLKDPRTVRPLMLDIEAHPASLERHYLLLHGLLSNQPAEPALVKLLRAPHGDTRFYAAEALAESGDPALAAYVPRLTADPDLRVRLAATEMGFALPEQAFAAVRDALVPLLQSENVELRLRVACGFAARGDAVGSRTLLEFWKSSAPPPNGDWRIMQAIGKLTGQTFNYNIHNWGPGNPDNRRAIAAFEGWITGHRGVQATEVEDRAGTREVRSLIRFGH